MKPEPSCGNCVHFRGHRKKKKECFCKLADEYRISFGMLLGSCYQEPWKYYRWDGSEEGK